MNEEKVVKVDEEIKDLYFGEGHSFDTKPALRKIWDEIKNNEEVLMYATRINATESDFIAPHIASLVLIDYLNADPLAYDVIKTRIFNNLDIARNVNPFTSKYKLSYLVTLLFNDSLKLNNNERDKLLNEARECYGSYNYNGILLRKSISLKEINTPEKLESFFEYCKYKNFHGIFPIDIRYFIFDNKYLDFNLEPTDLYYTVNFGYHSAMFDPLYSDNTLDDYKKLLMDYETRAKLRKLKKLSF